MAVHAKMNRILDLSDIAVLRFLFCNAGLDTPPTRQYFNSRRLSANIPLVRRFGWTGFWCCRVFELRAGYGFAKGFFAGCRAARYRSPYRAQAGLAQGAERLQLCQKALFANKRTI
jgi:hypothetical protein